MSGCPNSRALSDNRRKTRGRISQKLGMIALTYTFIRPTHTHKVAHLEKATSSAYRKELQTQSVVITL